MAKPDLLFEMRAATCAMLDGSLQTARLTLYNCGHSEEAGPDLCDE